MKLIFFLTFFFLFEPLAIRSGSHTDLFQMELLYLVDSVFQVRPETVLFIFKNTQCWMDTPDF